MIRPLAWAGTATAVLAVVALAATWRVALAPITPPSSFSRAAVMRGGGLAHLGYCEVCHNAPDGAPFAGGAALKTSFGLIYASNITPDPTTGIGRWSKSAFVRAMRDGVARNGRHLYPAFPYDHFRRASDQDLADLYAYLMTRRPIARRAPANRMVVPFGFRPLLAGWKLLFLHHRPIAPDPSRPADWNRGRELAEGLSHCGGCHRPRNALGAEAAGAGYPGGFAEGWYAPPLDAASPAVRPWNADRLYAYLRTGLSTDHAAAAGPMGPVVREMAAAPSDDVRDISVYIASLMARAPAPARPSAAQDHAADAARTHPQGAVLFAGACAGCHEAGAGMMRQGRPPLPLGTPLYEDSPRDVVKIMLEGLKPPVGRAGPYMPGFADSLTAAQVAEIAAYLRARASDRPPWPDLERAVAAARKEGAS